MSELIAIAYPDMHRASEVMATLGRLQVEHLVDLEDACVVTRDHDGKVRLQQALNLTASGALTGAFWGTLIGVLFLSPFVGLAVGAASGAAAGALSDIGINDDFMKSLGESLPPNSSAIFALVRKATPERVEEEIARHGGTILRTSLSREQEAELQAALDGGGIIHPIDLAHNTGTATSNPSRPTDPSGTTFTAS
ncbi:MAG: DUF1269 domain-containing protein [Armatimonadaceae bacterium]